MTIIPRSCHSEPGCRHKIILAPEPYDGRPMRTSTFLRRSKQWKCMSLQDNFDRRLLPDLTWPGLQICADFRIAGSQLFLPGLLTLKFESTRFRVPHAG